MPVPPSWIEYRRGRDAELLGWMVPVDDAFVVVDLLGHERSEPVDWLSGEELLEGIGLGYLAEPYELLLDDGTWLPVRLTQVSTDEITVKKEDGGAINAPRVEHTVPFPSHDRLRSTSSARS